MAENKGKKAFRDKLRRERIRLGKGTSTRKGFLWLLANEVKTGMCKNYLHNINKCTCPPEATDEIRAENRR